MNASRRRSAVRWPQIALMVLVALIVGVFVGGHTGWMPGWIRSAFTNQTAQDAQAENIIGLIQKNYYRPIGAQQLLNQGLEGDIASLKDPYSHYFPPTQEQQFQQETNPQVDGVGIEVSPSKDGPYIEQVFPGGPAAAAKLVAGETIVAVNGRSVKGLSLDKTSGLITGKAGTPVTLTLSQGTKKLRTVTIKRAEVTEPVASSTLIRYKGLKIGYLEFAQFTQGSGDQLRAQVRKLQRAGAQGLILDLRDNPGGLVTQAINVASIFLKNGTIVSTRGRNQPTTVYTALGDAIAPTIPLTVLVNRDTASSAEIVTAALQQRGRAKVVGTRTYGKGVFQQSQTVDGGGILDITVGEFFTPDGGNLGGKGVSSGKDLTRGPGIKPNYYVADNPDDPGPAALHKAEAVLAGEL